MRYLSLFSGAGGGDLAMQHLLGFKCVGYVEYEPYCQKVIRQRIEDGLLDSAPIFGDIRVFNSEGYAAAYQGMVDLITGGFPCTDISCAKSVDYGIDGEQSGLWSCYKDCICYIRPRLAFVENSAALTVRGMERVLSDLAQVGYDARWCSLSVSALGGFHKRERLWLVAYPHSIGLQGRDDTTAKVNWQTENTPIQALVPCCSWPDVSNPRSYGGDDALAYRVDRTRAIGNGQVPIVAATAFRILAG